MNKISTITIVISVAGALAAALIIPLYPFLSSPAASFNSSQISLSTGMEGMMHSSGRFAMGGMMGGLMGYYPMVRDPISHTNAKAIAVRYLESLDSADFMIH